MIAKTIGRVLALILFLAAAAIAQTWLAGEMDVSPREIGMFPDIDNKTFSCHLIPPVKSFLQNAQEGDMVAQLRGLP
jgi:hypothetical protein